MRGRRSASKVSSDDACVNTATAKKDWFLKPQDLSSVPSFGGGAFWGAGRLPTLYRVKDLDRLALRVHGSAGLAKKKEARRKRAEKAAQAGSKKKAPTKRPVAPEESDEADATPSKFQKKSAAKRGREGDGGQKLVSAATTKKRAKQNDNGAQVELNLGAVGNWRVNDEEWDSTMRIWQGRGAGASLLANALVVGCEVDMKCVDLSAEEMRFRAVFKTQRTKYVGVMTAQVKNKNKLLISFANGAPGMSRVETLNSVAKRTK